MSSAADIDQGGGSKVWRPPASITPVHLIWRFFSRELVISAVCGGLLTLSRWAAALARSLKPEVSLPANELEGTEKSCFPGGQTPAPLGENFGAIFFPEVFLGAAPEVRAAALGLLDQVCRPMTAREIEAALRSAGVSKSQRTRLAGALKGIAIVAIAAEPSPSNRETRHVRG